MRPFPRITLASAALLAAAASNGHAQTVLTDPGVEFVATELTGFATTGSEMGGMLVTAFFTDGTSGNGVWADLLDGTWGVSVPSSFRLSVGAGDDTFTAPWTFVNSSGAGLRRLVINGAPGKTVFDIVNGDFLSDGSANGRPMTITGDPFGTTATYRNIVRIGAVAPLGDLYETLDAVFSTPVTIRTFQFVADTDNVSARGRLTPVPEPATYGLVAAGLALIAAAGRRRIT